jgi:hypothetical protein
VLRVLSWIGIAKELRPFPTAAERP